ncbi:MAG: restriction endonuclease subunit S [Chitinispirillales bacterium]|jgi:type I restriction enzyme S subunit|nr:restriction endonuclease subunit S [Chitinispirillales bacterium]
MRFDDVVKILSPNTTSRSFMTDADGLKCVHYGDIYKNYSDRDINSSKIVNSISLKIPEHKVIKRDAIIIADVSETLDDWGHVTFIKFDGTPFINGTHTFAFVCDCAITLRYLFYYFRDETNRKRLRQFLTGVTVFQMSIKSLSKYKIELPPLPTQTRIASILSAYDTAIENNTRRIALLEKAARELYREWFVRLRFPGWERTRVVEGVPEGWEVKKIGDIVRLQRGHDLPITSVRHGEYPVVGSSGIIAFHDKITTQPPVIVLGRSGSVGNPKYYDCECWIHNTAIYAKEIFGEPLWVYYMLCQIDYSSLVGGSAVPTLNRNHVEARKVLVPNKGLQKKFNSYANIMFREVSILKSQSQNLARQRDLLLPRLMSGKLEV